MNLLQQWPHWKRGKDFLGVEYPVISGAMTWISNATLVEAVARAGGLGMLAGGNMPPDLLAQEIRTLLATGLPFGVNLITIAPLYQDHLRLLEELHVPLVVFAGSFPRKEEIVRMKTTGARVLCFASTESIARRMIEYGTDGLILEGSEAGGHIGHVSTVVLLQQILFRFPQVPVFVAGGIATGRMMAHLFLMGAAGVQMGTIFAMAEESPAHPRFKERFRKARAREAVSTPQYDSALPVVSVRALNNRGMEAFGTLQLDLLRQLEQGRITRQEAQYQVEHYWVGALRRAVVDGDVAEGSLMAGQSVGLVTETLPVADLLQQLIQEAETTFATLHRDLTALSPQP